MHRVLHRSYPPFHWKTNTFVHGVTRKSMVFVSVAIFQMSQTSGATSSATTAIHLVLLPPKIQPKVPPMNLILTSFHRRSFLLHFVRLYPGKIHLRRSRRQREQNPTLRRNHLRRKHPRSHHRFIHFQIKVLASNRLIVFHPNHHLQNRNICFMTLRN